MVILYKIYLMQDDPDLRPIGLQPQEVYFNGATTQGPGGFLAGAVHNKPIILVALLLTVLNVVFLSVQSIYSLGLFGTERLGFESSTYLATVIMVLISGTFGFMSAVIGYHLSRTLGSLVLVLANRIMLVVILILSVVILLAPIFNRSAGI